ncbi:unnamed protein product [Polarella glacialis]|uniref:Saposin B-type domain-containing protein n=1 Tax=Polarella glacialis TaxID=89957 RepID=A0A813DVW4_POLGL|nr:unnamed protein product [Polarella glacialis]
MEKMPDESEKDEALSVIPKVRCDVCATILNSLLSKARSFSEDDLADALEGNADHELTGDTVRDRMLSHKKGCNKHFKDELISEGYALRQCREVVEGRSDSDPCLWRAPDRPNQNAADTYELWKEIFFYSCEQSIGSHRDAMVEVLMERLEGRSLAEVNRTALSREVCEVTARCGAGAKGKKTKGEHQAKAKKPKAKGEL